jgi:hypothetical protein
MSKLIDIEACKEFMNETLDKIDRNDLTGIAEELKSKSEFFVEYLNQDRISSISENELQEIFKRIFVTRRKSKLLFEHYSFEQLKAGIIDLLYEKKDIENRFQDFVDSFKELDVFLRFDMAGEILHYTNPDKYWLWCRWLWDPKANTGALPLVTNEEFKLSAASYGEMYMNVGKAVAFVHSMAESAEFQFINRSLFGTDVYLSCVYVIYAYTILKIKMTDEFNKVMPGLPEFSRRILGIYSSKEMTVV